MLSTMRWLALLLLLLLTACTPRVYQPYPIGPIILPNDDAAHLAPIEWWYYTGHLFTEEGEQYGFELTFFKAYAPQRMKLLGFLPLYTITEKGHVAHFAITDLTKQTFDAAERADFWGFEAAASSTDLDVFVADWYARRASDGLSHEIYARLGDKKLQLNLSPQKPAALHGNPPGIQPMGPGGVSYYLSYTRMAVAGKISTDCTLLACRVQTVTGQGWHDHQWGDFSLSSYAGWDWFSLQLDDQTELMLYLIREPPGSYSTRAGSFITRDGRTLELTARDFSLEATGETWLSPTTGAIYPASWQIKVPGQGIEVLVEPLLPQQEMNTRASTGIVYWEGAVRVKGSSEGLGYVELTNYDLYPFGLTDASTPLKPLRGPAGF